MIHPVDKYVGRRLRERRTVLGFSQEDIGKRTKITFQQVQKYEKGFNRIAISRLYEFSQILQVPIEWFLVGFEARESADVLITDLDSKETLALIKAYSVLSPDIRKRALQLFKAIASEDDSDNNMVVDE